MRRHTATLATVTAAALLAAATAHAQFGRGAGEWNTAGGDAQRSGWVRSDQKISRGALAKPGFAMLYKVKLDSAARQSNNLTPALVMTGYIGYRGFRSLGFLTGASDRIYALDIDLGRIEWQKPLPGAPASSATAACPGGITSNVARLLPTAFPAMTAGGGGRGGAGRGSAARSAVGEPEEGSVVLKEVEARMAAMARANTGSAARAGRGFANGPPRRVPNYVYALGSDGVLHGMYVSNGEEPEPGIPFLRPNANAQGLIVTDGMAYVATTGGCGNVPDGVWAVNLETKKVVNWAGKVAGSEGLAIGPDGTVYVSTTSGDLVGLDGKTLQVKDSYQAKQGLTTSPILFQYKDRTIAAATAKDGSIHLLDVAKMSSPFAPPAAANATGAGLASWQDTDGTRWLLVPTAGSVAAWKLVEENGAPALKKGWTSPDITSPAAPMVINGVVFAASSGQRNTPAVLYALDGGSGKELWNSGKTIAGFLSRNGGISGGGTQIYLGTNDGTLYAFGFPMEH